MTDTLINQTDSELIDWLEANHADVVSVYDRLSEEWQWTVTMYGNITERYPKWREAVIAAMKGEWAE